MQVVSEDHLSYAAPAKRPSQHVALIGSFLSLLPDGQGIDLF